MPWSSSRPGGKRVNPKYTSKEHLDAVKAHRAALERDGSGSCAEVVCLRSSRLILPDMDLHLCHDRNTGIVLGLGHAECNRSEAGKYARAQQELAKRGGAPPARSRDWIWGTRVKTPRVPKEKKVKVKLSRDPLTCIVCLTVFVPTGKRKYCSETCSLEWNARQIREAYRVKVGLPATWDVPTKPWGRAA